MRYKLRTLLIVLALLPPVLAWGWRKVEEHQRRQEIKRLLLAMESYSSAHLPRNPKPAIRYEQIIWRSEAATDSAP